MKTLFYLPTLLMRLIQSWLPRGMFVRLYQPSTELERDLEHNIRNQTNLAAYYAKRVMFGDQE